MLGQGRRGLRRGLGPLLGGALLLGPPAVAQADISVDDVQVTEADGTVSATFTLTRTAGLLAPSRVVAVQTADGSATAPADFAPVNGSIGFPGAPLGGTTTRQVTVAVRGDDLDEPAEVYRLLVTGPEVTDGAGAGTILDDDAPPAVRVADAPAVSEAGGEASFAVTLSGPSGREVSVAFATADGTATAAADYSAASGRLTIPAGATGATVRVPVLDDAVDEAGEETFALGLASPVDATIADDEATGTILDNDEPPPPPPPPAKPSVPGPTAPAAQPTPAGAFGGPTAAGPAAGTTTPRLGLGSPRLRRPATALLTISCPRDAGSCQGRVTLFSRPNRRSKIAALRRERNLGRRTFTLDGGRTTTLTLVLKRADRRLLQRSGRMNVRAFAVVEDAAGRSGVRTVNGTLVARTAHSSARP